MQTVSKRDRKLREAVLRQLEWDPEVASKDVSVAAADRVITLTGFVHRYSEKYAAEKAAKSIYGVRAVANDIEVKPGAARSDPEIARDVSQAVRLDVTVSGDEIKTTVQDGFVTLDGVVEWNFQRDRVEACARNIPGVRGVMNHVALKPKPVSPAEVLDKIEAALRRNAEVDSRRITVWAEEGQVHLYGTVRTWVQREEAERAAWSAPGVIEVIDHIAVTP